MLFRFKRVQKRYGERMPNILNLQDERYAQYIGQMAIVPETFGRHVPILADKVPFFFLIIILMLVEYRLCYLVFLYC